MFLLWVQLFLLRVQFSYSGFSDSTLDPVFLLRIKFFSATDPVAMPSDALSHPGIGFLLLLKVSRTVPVYKAAVLQI